MDIGGWYKTQDPAGWLSASLPRPPLTPEQARCLASLGSHLSELNYDEYAIREMLDGMDLGGRRFEQIPGYVWRFGQVGSPAARLAAFGLIRQPLKLSEARHLFGSERLAALAHLRLVAIDGDEVRALADLYPCRNRYLFADLKFSPYQRLPNHVYEVGSDSYYLARTTPRGQVGRSLDLCLGSGVHAILAAGHSHEVRGVDVNPRAVEIAGINALINGLADRCQFHRGDLYEPIGDQQFDLITANTPFVPTPPDEVLEAYRWGGETGEDLNRRLIAGLPGHLAPGGTLALFTNYPVQEGVDYLDRLAEWMGESAGWGISLLRFGYTLRELYIELQIFDWDPHKDADEYRRRFTRWVETYHRHKILGVAEGTIIIRRLPAGHPGYRQTLTIGPPAFDRCDTVSAWLEALERFSDPELQLGPPRVHPEVQRLLTDVGDAGGQAIFRPGWNHVEELDASEVSLIRGLDGSSVEEAQSERVRSLGRRMVLTA